MVDGIEIGSPRIYILTYKKRAFAQRSACFHQTDIYDISVWKVMPLLCRWGIWELRGVQWLMIHHDGRIVDFSPR